MHANIAVSQIICFHAPRLTDCNSCCLKACSIWLNMEQEEAGKAGQNNRSESLSFSRSLSFLSQGSAASLLLASLFVNCFVSERLEETGRVHVATN